MNASAPLSPYLSLSAVLRALRGEVGGWTVRRLLSEVLALLLYRRLGEICRKIERLAARFQAGRLWRRGARAKASPQAARILRPVCRMLAIETSVLRPGVVVPEPVVREVKPRIRKPRVPIDWGRIPLPRGVLTAVRRRRFCMSG